MCYVLAEVNQCCIFPCWPYPNMPHYLLNLLYSPYHDNPVCVCARAHAHACLIVVRWWSREHTQYYTTAAGAACDQLSIAGCNCAQADSGLLTRVTVTLWPQMGRRLWCEHWGWTHTRAQPLKSLSCCLTFNAINLFVSEMFKRLTFLQKQLVFTTLSI